MKIKLTHCIDDTDKGFNVFEVVKESGNVDVSADCITLLGIEVEDTIWTEPNFKVYTEDVILENERYIITFDELLGDMYKLYIKEL